MFLPISGLLNGGYTALSPTSLLCLLAFVPWSRAQKLADSTSTLPLVVSTSETITMRLSTLSSLSTFRTPSSASSTSNTTSSSTSKPTEQPPSELFPVTTPPDRDPTGNTSAFNYYFLFLAAFAAIVVVLLWWRHGRRKRRKRLMRLNGQHALARDLDGWTNTRRFMHGRYGRDFTTVVVRSEEGLDEHGDAPPPYQAKSEVDVAGEPLRVAQAPASPVTIPLRALFPDEIERARPPEYYDTCQADSSPSPRLTTPR